MNERKAAESRNEGRMKVRKGGRKNKNCSETAHHRLEELQDKHQTDKTQQKARAAGLGPGVLPKKNHIHNSTSHAYQNLHGTTLADRDGPNLHHNSIAAEVGSLVPW